MPVINLLFLSPKCSLPCLALWDRDWAPLLAATMLALSVEGAAGKLQGKGSRKALLFLVLGLLPSSFTAGARCGCVQGLTKLMWPYISCLLASDIVGHICPSRNAGSSCTMPFGFCRSSIPSLGPLSFTIQICQCFLLEFFPKLLAQVTSSNLYSFKAFCIYLPWRHHPVILCSDPPSFLRDMFQDLQWMPETMDSTEPWICYFFFLYR